MNVHSFCFGSGKGNLYKSKKRTMSQFADKHDMKDLNFENEVVFNDSPLELNNTLDIDEVENFVLDNDLNGFEILETVPEIELEFENVDFNHI